MGAFDIRGGAGDYLSVSFRLMYSKNEPSRSPVAWKQGGSTSLYPPTVSTRHHGFFFCVCVCVGGPYIKLPLPHIILLKVEDMHLQRMSRTPMQRAQPSSNFLFAACAVSSAQVACSFYRVMRNSHWGWGVLSIPLSSSQNPHRGLGTGGFKHTWAQSSHMSPAWTWHLSHEQL